MARKRKSARRPDGTPGSTFTFDTPAWLGFRIPERRAEEWVTTARKFWSDPKTSNLLKVLGREFNQCQTKMRAHLAAIAWPRVGAWDLIGHLGSALSIDIGVATFLPPTHPLPLWERRRLFMTGLILHGGMDESLKGDRFFPALKKLVPETHDSVFLALYLPLKAAIFDLAGHFAVAEINRRGLQHVGFHAAILLFLMNASKRSARAARDPFVAEEAERAVKTLRKAAWRMTPSETRQELTGQIPLSLAAKWGHLDPIELLARSLEGGLDIAPRAIRDDLVKNAKREDKRREVEVLLQRPTKEEEESPREWEDVLSSREWDPQEETRWRQLVGRVKRNLRLRRLTLGALEGAETQKALARRLKVDPRTIRNWWAELKKMLEE